MRKNPKIKFVNLHQHSTFSPYDGMGSPKDHMEFAYENGLDAWAITEHGHMNSLSHVYVHQQKMEKEGKRLKVIFGNEAYWIPSIEQWKKDNLRYKELSAQNKRKSKDDEDISDDSRDMVKEDAEAQENKELSEFDLAKRYNWHKRHLLLVAQNQTGLNNLFKLTSLSHTGDAFYQKPRVDSEMLRRYNEGIIATSACIDGNALVSTNCGKIPLKEVVERISSGEELFVLSYHEEKKVIKYRRALSGQLTKKSATVVKIKLKNGAELKLTPDHQVLTNIGWLRADELSKHENIQILSLK